MTGIGKMASAVVLAASLLIGPTSYPACAADGDVDVTALVNPFVGTAEHGHTYPGATVPFGMVQLSPDTGTQGWDWCSGYHWSDDSILGFSHTHLSGTGCPDLGDVLFMPVAGEVKLEPGTKEHPESGYRARFSHEDEHASPGYYSVRLKDSGITAELTATPHVGLHRYLYPSGVQRNVVIDLGHGIGDKPLAGELSVIDDHTLAGVRHSRGWAKSQYIFFVAQFNKPFKSYGTTSDGGAPQAGSLHDDGQQVTGWVTFDAGTDPIVAKVALSTTGTEGAWKNLHAEVPGFDFDAARQAAHEEWKTKLSKVQVKGGTEDQQRTFYSALYHCYLAPTLISDVDGTFRGADHEVHRASGVRNVYSTFSLWDTFRAEQPLFTLLEPDRVNEMIESFALQAKYHPEHRLPIWPLYGHETYCMIGYHSFPVIAEAYAKGIRGWNADELYSMMVRDTKRNDWWADKLYMPADKEKESVSKTLEFAYDDWALAQFAKALGKQADYDKYMRRATAYRQVFDPSTGFMRAKLADGSWRTPFNPVDVTQPDAHDFTEGNSWQYSFFVPQDVAGLIGLMGGRKAFVAKLDQLFDHPPIENWKKVEDVSGLIGQYAHGNEPSHHVAYLYSYAGEPAKTADRVRAVEDTLYNSTPAGLCGNEDCGQMSAWYVFSALGFYPVNPVQATYVFGAPIFSEATLHLASGRALHVVARDVSDKSRYITDAMLNGKPLSRVYLTHEQLLAGGNLALSMSDKPGDWGKDVSAAPPSMTTASTATANAGSASK